MLQMIDKLCTECSALIENHEKIQVLSAVHYNLGKTLQVNLEQHAGNAAYKLQVVWLCSATH